MRKIREVALVITEFRGPRALDPLGRFLWIAAAVLLVCCVSEFSCGTVDQDENGPAENPYWNTFLGSSESDIPGGAVTDSSGNIYVTGYSYESWDSPLIAHSGLCDAFVAKIDKKGTLIWNTFLGPLGSSGENKCSIALDEQGNIYVTGMSTENWGYPIKPHVFGRETFVAKLNNAGGLVWNTFLNSNDCGHAGGIALNTNGDIFVTGASFQSWGTPVRLFAGHADIFVVKLNNNGHLIWNTFLGSDSYGDDGRGVDADNNGNVYVVGTSCFSWGSPVRPISHPGSIDAFVAKLDGNGQLLWNTFLGGNGGSEDYAEEIETDGLGALYVVGTSNSESWGAPVRAYSHYDAFVAKLDVSGLLLWNTFLGSAEWDEARDVALDSEGFVYVTGTSHGGWGPAAADFHIGDSDAFVGKLGSNGSLVGNGFYGSQDRDQGEAILADAAGKIFLIGASYGTWGKPIRPYSRSSDGYPINEADVFVAKREGLR